MIRVVISMFGIVLLVCALMPPLSVDAQRKEATVAAIWTFDDGSARDSSGKGVNGIFAGKPETVAGIAGDALRFNGESDGIKPPDSANINTGGPYTDRTIAAFFNCDDVSIKERKQVIYEEGGRTRGLVIYVHDRKVYVGGWNRAEYNWNGEWPSADVKSKQWYHVGLVLRDASDKVENNKFELWLDGKRVAREPGGQLHAHADNIGIGHTNQNAVYHDDGGSGTNIDWFEGMLDDMIVYGSAFDAADFAELARPLNVEPSGKSTTTWAALKSQRAP